MRSRDITVRGNRTLAKLTSMQSCILRKVMHLGRTEWIPERKSTSKTVKKAGMVFPESGQSDYQSGSGGRCGVRTGEYGHTHKGNPKGAGGEKA